MIKTNFFNKVVGVCLNQPYKIKLDPVAFYSRKLSPAGLNYNIYNKELLAIINTFK